MIEVGAFLRVMRPFEKQRRNGLCSLDPGCVRRRPAEASMQHQSAQAIVRSRNWLGDFSPAARLNFRVLRRCRVWRRVLRRHYVVFGRDL